MMGEESVCMWINYKFSEKHVDKVGQSSLFNVKLRVNIRNEIRIGRYEWRIYQYMI